MHVGDKVQVKGTSIIGKVVQVGKYGLVRIKSNKAFTFGGDIYYPEELEVIV